MQLRTSEIFDYVKKLEKAIGDLQGEVATLKTLVVQNGITVDGGGVLVTAGGIGVSAGDIDVTTGNVNIDAGDLNVVTGGLNVAGTANLDGGPVSYGANDSGGAGFRACIVPNAI